MEKTWTYSAAAELGSARGRIRKGNGLGKDRTSKLLMKPELIRRSLGPRLTFHSQRVYYSFNLDVVSLSLPARCVSAKRPLTEETMAAFMHQLNLSTSVSHSSAPSPLSVAGPLNITAVTTCPSTNACCPDELRTRGVSSSQVSPSHEERYFLVYQAP